MELHHGLNRCVLTEASAQWATINKDSLTDRREQPQNFEIYCCQSNEISLFVKDSVCYYYLGTTSSHNPKSNTEPVSHYKTLREMEQKENKQLWTPQNFWTGKAPKGYLEWNLCNFCHMKKIPSSSSMFFLQTIQEVEGCAEPRIPTGKDRPRNLVKSYIWSPAAIKSSWLRRTGWTFLWIFWIRIADHLLQWIQIPSFREGVQPNLVGIFTDW